MIGFGKNDGDKSLDCVDRIGVERSSVECEERFERMLDFISSAGKEEWRGLDYPLLLKRFAVDETESEKRMMSLFGMSGYDVVGRLKTGDYIGLSLVNGKYYGCQPNI